MQSASFFLPAGIIFWYQLKGLKAQKQGVWFGGIKKT